MNSLLHHDISIASNHSDNATRLLRLESTWHSLESDLNMVLGYKRGESYAMVKSQKEPGLLISLWTAIAIQYGDRDMYHRSPMNLPHLTHFHASCFY